MFLHYSSIVEVRLDGEVILLGVKKLLLARTVNSLRWPRNKNEKTSALGLAGLGAPANNLIGSEPI